MSAIFGQVSFGRPPSRDDIEPVRKRLAFRGPDGSRVWTGDAAVLGHALLATTPEAEVEAQPWEHAESGCVITADARLDNRQELAAALSVDLHERIVGDGELILRAWLRWGEDCPRRLLGDFAFAIWDARARRLFCARDHMGLRQLIWGMPRPDALVFATDARAVRAAAPDRFPPNEARIADFLENLNLEGIDLEVTFFQGVSRLPPAHFLVFDQAGLRVDRYWALEAPPLRAASEAEHAAGFIEVFGRAVEARLRSARPVAAMLSGGMDSTSVCAMAAEILAAENRGPLVTISAVGPDAETCPETRFARMAGRLPGLEPHYVDHSRLDHLVPALLEQIRDLGEPFDWYMNLWRAVYLTAAGLGANVVLDGGAGDVVFKPGDLQARLLRRGRIAAALEDIRGQRDYWGSGPSPAYGLAEASWRAFMPEPVKLLRHRLANRLQSLRGSESRVGSDLARRIDMPRRRYRHRIAGRGADSRLGAVLLPIVTTGKERYDRVAAQSGIEPRDPFLDIRVISYLLGVPPELMRADGWPKAFLRKGMAGRIPDALRWRRDTVGLGPLFTERLIAAISSRPLPDWLASIGKQQADACEPNGITDAVAVELQVLACYFES